MTEQVSETGQELEHLLSEISKRVVPYVSNASSPNADLGRPISPTELGKILNLDLPDKGKGEEGFLENFDKILDHSVVTWHPGFMDKLYASTNPAGVGSDILLSILNTNSHVFNVSPSITLVERKTGHEYAKLFGFTEKYSGGITLPGGSASNTHSLATARSVLFPETKKEGNGTKRFAIFTSLHSHYSVEKAAILLGFGSASVFKIPVDSIGRMKTEELDRAINESKKDGWTPLYINATAGTTVYGAFDFFEDISIIAKKYKLWFHVDGSWGGNVIFSAKENHILKGIHLADSITVNPHKMLGVPVTCSFLLVPDVRVLQEAHTLKAPYLFHGDHGGDGDEPPYDLGDYTSGCGRRTDAIKLFLGWQWYGRKGYGDRIDHAYRVTRYFANKIQNRRGFTLVTPNPSPCLQTCFYYSPSGTFIKDSQVNSKVTRTIAKRLQTSGRFLVDYAPPVESDSAGEFFRAVVNATNCTESTIDELVELIEKFGNSLA